MAFVSTDHLLGRTCSASARGASRICFSGCCIATSGLGYHLLSSSSKCFRKCPMTAGFKLNSRRFTRSVYIIGQSGSCAFANVSHVFWGHGLHRQRLGPWLYVPFRTDFRYLTARGQTSGSLSHTLGYGGVVLGRTHACGTSGNPVFNLLVWPWPLSLTLIIVGSWHRWQGTRQNVETEIGWGKRGVLAGLCFARTARIRRPILQTSNSPEKRRNRGGNVVKSGPVV